MRRLSDRAGGGRALVAVVAIGALAGAGCGRKRSEPSVENFTRAMATYLEKRGVLCVAKNEWPIDVTSAEFLHGDRNAVQLPVLERLGLVTSIETTAEVKTDEGPPVAREVKRYDLTEAGRRYYIARGPGEPPDLCAARLTLDKVVSWEVTGAKTDRPQASVSYTYVVDAFPWAREPEARRVFPAVDRVIVGARTAELKETFALTGDGWVAIDLLGEHP
jgi:hypothetical protein